ncbi:MAG: Ig-like domain-containing protein [Verrucomicrobiales bacterium]|nr:Ig-like domain-containing protein [Verrucomicrobiales bacterium]
MGPGVLRHQNAPDTGFYQVLLMPREAPRDTDGDGLDDVFELERPESLNPLDPADAGRPAPGAGGKTWLELYTELRAPLTTVADMSPFQNEDGVAVTREAVFRLTRPLAPDALLTVSNVHATFGGRRILGRVEISADRQAVTYFPTENLPASARVRVTFDPGDARDDLGRRLDLAGSGVSWQRGPRGLLTR